MFVTALRFIHGVEQRFAGSGAVDLHEGAGGDGGQALVGQVSCQCGHGIIVTDGFEAADEEFLHLFVLYFFEGFNVRLYSGGFEAFLAGLGYVKCISGEGELGGGVIAFAGSGHHGSDAEHPFFAHFGEGLHIGFECGKIFSGLLLQQVRHFCMRGAVVLLRLGENGHLGKATGCDQ